MLRQVFTAPSPYAADDAGRSSFERGRWPCRWIAPAKENPPPVVAAYRLRFDLAEPIRARVHLAADERYLLFIDGIEAARGSERGTPDGWYYDSYELALEPGTHVLVAQVLSAGGAAPRAQMSIRHGFLFSPQEARFRSLLGSGQAAWEVKPLDGFYFEPPFDHDRYSRGGNIVLDGRRHPWDFVTGGGDGWEPARPLHFGTDAGTSNRYGAVHLLTPSTLPTPCGPRLAAVARYVSEGNGEIIERAGLATESSAWNRLVNAGDELTIEPGCRRRILLDLEKYRCALAGLTLSGGRDATLQLHWAESLYHEPEARTKGQRDQIEGKHFVGVGDTLIADGGSRRRWRSLWLQAGRYVQLEIQTAAEPLTLHAFDLIEYRYPLEAEGRFASGDSRLGALTAMALRSLQCCCHDAYVDGPYYEQMMWLGDSRLKALAQYTISLDDRLARKALTIFDRSRLSGRLTRARYPARDTMIIAPYSLLWVGMIHDFAQWRGDRAFVAALLPGMRSVLDTVGAFENNRGFVNAPPGWNFMDWAVGWAQGIPPDGNRGVSGALNWLYVLALGWAVDLEEWLGESLLARRWRERADALSARLVAAFWVEKRGLLADDLAGGSFSEHTQSLAVLTGRVPPSKLERMARSFPAGGVTAATLYFSHYVLEAFARMEVPEAITSRLHSWFSFAQTGLTTLPEKPEPTRSDCHGWGAHVLYHGLATLLGVRPAGFGFERVQVRPRFCGTDHLSGSVVHPHGPIEADFRLSDDRVTGTICLPEGLSGEFMFAGQSRVLSEGLNLLDVERCHPLNRATAP